MSWFQYIYREQQVVMKIDITVCQIRQHLNIPITLYRPDAKVCLYKNSYECTPEYIFYTDERGKVSAMITDSSTFYVQAFWGAYKSDVIILESTMNLYLPTILQKRVIPSDSWYYNGGKRTIRVTDVSTPSKVDTDTTVSGLADEGTQIIELYTNSELNFDGVALVDTTTLTNQKITTHPNVVKGRYLYSFDDNDIYVKGYVSGNSISKVFSLHSYRKALKDDNVFIWPAFIGDGSILKFDGVPSDYSIGQYSVSESVGDGIWAKYTNDDNAYFSISVKNNNRRIVEKMNVIKGYEYTFNIFTLSEVYNDGVAITTYDTNNIQNNLNNTSALLKCSGIKHSRKYTYIPQKDETIYITFITNESGINWIDSTTGVDETVDTEYGEVRVNIKKPTIYEVKFYANGNPCVIGNVETSSDGYVIGEYILKDKLKSVVPADKSHIFLGWGNSPENPDMIYKIDNVVDPSTLPSKLYAIWEDKYGYYKVKVINDADKEILTGATVIFYDDSLNSNSVGSVITDETGRAIFSISMENAPERLYALPILDGYVYNSINMVVDRSETQDMDNDVTILYMDISNDGEDAGMKSILKTMFSKLSSNHIKKCINDNEDVEYDEDGYRINIVDPDSVNTLDIFTSVPVIMNNDNKNIIGSVDTSLKQDTNELNIKTINRYSGYYNPIFKDILFYDNFNKNCPYSNTKFDDDYEDNYGKFGVIKNMWFHKVNDEKSMEIVSSLTPYYPLTGQYALDCKDYNIFSSSWDMNYYTKQMDTLHSEECINVASMKNGLCMFGSKYLNTPETIEIECLSGHQEWNDEWITSPNGCDGEMMYKEVNRNNIKFYLFLRKRILRYFYEKLYNEFSKYISKDYSYGNKGIEDDINEYVNKNILKLYRLERIRLFVRQDKTGVHDTRIDNDYITYIDRTVDELKKDGFNETRTISVSKISLDDFDRQITYNLKNGYKEDFGFSFIIKKI